MPRRTRLRRREADLDWYAGDSDELDLLTDREIEEVLFEEDVVKPPSPVNFSTIAGLALLCLGMLHVLGTAFGSGFSGGLLTFLAVTGGALALLTGMAGRKKAKRRKSGKRIARARKKARQRAQAKPVAATPDRDSIGSYTLRRPGLYKSKREKWVFGVCGGLAERMDIEVALIRIGFAATTILSGGFLGPVIYIILALSMRNPDKEL
ncbi:MAG: PspC domain-containing protein [Bacteroidota bacterium]|nr:PspC domain-containing protein [Bacteroidota bacterium]MDE2834915.1 PspC domain-containing protein [Bacteroidota bacterium]